MPDLEEYMYYLATTLFIFFFFNLFIFILFYVLVDFNNNIGKFDLV